MTSQTAQPAIDRALFNIDWGQHNRDQQDAMLGACARPTLPQTPAYAAALADAGHAKTDFGLMRFHGRPVGYVIVERRPLFGKFSSHRIYRGPVWLDEGLPGTVQWEFLRLIRQRYRFRTGRPVTVHPELPDSKTNRGHLSATGFRRIADGYSTIWLDVSRPLEELRASLKPKWRNRLNQSERNNLRLQIDDKGEWLDWIITRHELHMAANNYRGPSRTLLEAMFQQGQSDGLVRILRALKDDDPVAAILLTRHGRSATYFVGWNGSEGRKQRGHHFLLWQAIRLLHGEEIRWFDLGGVNDADAAHVARFKAGLSGRRETLVGGYT